MTGPSHRPPEEDDPGPSRVGFGNRRAWMSKAAFEAALIVVALVLTRAISSWQDQRRLDSDLAETRAALVAMGADQPS